MNSVLGLFILACGIGFTLTVVFLLLKKKISERNSLAWLAGSVTILILSADPSLLDAAAEKLGIHYPPTLLFLFATLILLIMVLYQSIQISELNEKLRQLAQQVSLQQTREARRDPDEF